MTIHDLNANGREIGSKQMTQDWPIWLMIGATGFGGPAGQVAILHRELVEQRKWLDEEEFLAALGAGLPWSGRGGLRPPARSRERHGDIQR